MRLLFGSLTIGEIEDSIFSDETWNGTLKFIQTENNPILKRVQEYKLFCEKWNQRLQRNLKRPPDPKEFDKFQDLTNSDQWYIEDEVNNAIHHVNAPYFLHSDAFICRPWEYINK